MVRPLMPIFRTWSRPDSGSTTRPFAITRSKFWAWISVVMPIATPMISARARIRIDSSPWYGQLRHAERLERVQRRLRLSKFPPEVTHCHAFGREVKDAEPILLERRQTLLDIESLRWESAQPSHQRWPSGA